MHLGDRLLYLNPMVQIQRRRAGLNQACRELLLQHHRILDGYRLKFQRSVSRLESLSPLAVLNRGYSIAYRTGDRKIIRSFREVAAGQEVVIRLHEGHLDCLVQGTGNLRDEGSGKGDRGEEKK